MTAEVLVTRVNRRMVAPATVFCILVLCVGTAAGESLLRNASFEKPMDPFNWGCDMAAHWIRWGSWMNRETGWAPTKSGECLMGYHHWRLKGGDNGGFYQDIKEAKSGERYTFSIHAMKDKATNAKSVELALHSYHGGSVLATRTYSIMSLKKEEWNKLSITTTLPADGVRVMIFVEPKEKGMRKGAIKFDDAELTPATEDVSSRGIVGR
jgi:hypothetical protein